MISIIVPIFNAETTLNRCIDSILHQTCQDFELILINDGSTDASEAVCMSYVESHHGKIRYFRKENGGVSSARNLGIEKAWGEFVCFVDSDDYVDNSYLEVLYGGIMEYGTDFSMCDISRNTKGNYGDTILLEEKDDIISSIMSTQYGPLNRGPYCKFFLKKILQDGLCFAEDIFLGEDTLFCVEYAKRCKKGIYIRKGLYHYDTPTSSAAYRTDGRMLKKYLTYIDSRRKMLEDMSMLNRHSYVLITNSLYESIFDSYFVAKNAGAKEVQGQLCKQMADAQDKYSIKWEGQDKPFTWWIMANVPACFDYWMYIFGKWHGLLKKLKLL